MTAPPRLLFVCKECSRASGSPDLRKVLKKSLKAEGVGKKDVRIVRTECMGLCPEDGSVSVCDATGDALSTVERGDEEKLLDRLVELVSRKKR